MPAEMPLWRRANELRESGRYAESLEQLDLLLKQDLEDLQRAWVLYAREQLLLSLDRIPEAKASLERAAALANDYLRYLLEFEEAFITFAEKKYSTAVEMIERLLGRYSPDELRQNPDYTAVYRAAKAKLGQALFHLGQYSEAISALEAALSTERAFPAERYEIFPVLGAAHSYVGNYECARLYFQAALDEEQFAPKPLLSADVTANLRDWLAFIAYKQHDLETAKQELAAAAEIAEDKQMKKRIETRLRSLDG